jgi:hypothetical protein
MVSHICIPIWIQMTPDNEGVDCGYIHDIEEKLQKPPASLSLGKVSSNHLIQGIQAALCP